MLVRPFKAIVELKWLRPDAMLLVGSGSMLHLVDCTTQENVQDWFASTGEGPQLI
jgi:hypothetical protein